MASIIAERETEFVKRYQWIGIVVVCLASIPLHFVYDWTGESTIFGLFTPINESIWEHLKLVYWPLLLWWGIGYLIFRNKKKLVPTPWFTAAAVSIFISMTFIVSWYYVWTEAFGVHSSIIDIGSLFIAVPIAQLVAIHVYRVVRPRPIYLILAAVFLLLFAGLFVYFTFLAPDFRLFIPPS